MGNKLAPLGHPLVFAGAVALAQFIQIKPVHASSISPHMFERLGSGFCLNAYQPKKGSTVNLWDCDSNDPDQRFIGLPQGNDIWLVQRLGTNFCLNAHRPGRSSQVNLWPCDPTDSDQRWEAFSYGEINQHGLKRAGTNFCLNANRPSRASGFNLWDCDYNDADQYWKIRNPNLASSGNITLPFASGKTWYVCQGYQGPVSHQAIFALDLTFDNRDIGQSACWAYDNDVNKSANQEVIAPASGTITYVNSDLVCLTIDDQRSLLIGHMDRKVKANQFVDQGTLLGTVSAANAVNGGFAHIHFEARRSRGCQIYTSVPFTASNNLQIEGIGDLPNLLGSPDYHGKALSRP